MQLYISGSYQRRFFPIDTENFTPSTPCFLPLSFSSKSLQVTAATSPPATKGAWNSAVFWVHPIGSHHSQMQDFNEGRKGRFIDKFGFNYLILKNHWFFKASRLFFIQTLSVCPRFCPYEPKQGQFFIPRRPPYPAALRKYASLPL